MESNDKIQFIDWDGVDEPECVRVQSILFGQDKFVQVPSRKPPVPRTSRHGSQPPPPPPQQQQPQPPPPLLHQPPPPQQQQMQAVPPPMVSQAQWDPHRGMDMAPPEQAHSKPMMFPVVMSQQSMVSPTQYQQMLMPTGQNMMYMVQSQGPPSYKKEDEYRGYQQTAPPPMPPPPHGGHPLYIGHTGYPTAYPPSQLYYSTVYMQPQMQPEMQPPPVPPPDLYLPPQPEALKEAMMQNQVMVNTEASILQPNAPAFLPSYHPAASGKPPISYGGSSLQLRPNAPAFQPPPQEQPKQEQIEPEVPPPVVEEAPVVVEESVPEPEMPPPMVEAVPEQVVVVVEEEEVVSFTAPELEPEVVPELLPPPPQPAAPVKKSWASIAAGANVGDPIGAEAVPRSRPALPPFVQQEQSAGQAASEDDKFSLAAINNNNNISKTSNHLATGSDDMENDPFLYRLGEHLASYGLDHRSSPLQPRGLTNRSNWCYVNATLQALVACPPFYNLMRSLPYRTRNNNKFDRKSKTPIIDAVMDFMREFNPLPPGAKPARREKNLARKGEGDGVEVQQGAPFEPSCVYAMLGSIRSAAFKVEGRQEDAEEFLSCLLNGLNDEMLDLMKLVEGPAVKEPLVNGQAHPPTANGSSDIGSAEDEDSWTVMKSRNRGCVTRRSDFGRTPVSDIFRGQLCSHVQRKGDQQTENVQPFFTLQLDIERASSVKEALEQMVDKDRLEGITCSRTHQQVEAWQQVSLEELPPVLLLHLKWFDYKADGCSKIMKTVEYSVDLKIENKILSNKKSNYTPKQKVYKLFAVVYHDGKEATKGHYIADAYNSNLGIWVRYDDSQVRVVPEQVVLHPKSPSVPYILYYRRSDTMGQPSAAKTSDGVAK